MTIHSIVSNAPSPRTERPSLLGLTLVPSVADGLAQATLDDPRETALYAQLVRLAVRTLEPETVLDVGCGSGIPTVAAARAGAASVAGIDIEPRNVELAREAVRRAALERRVSIRHASWEDVYQGLVDVGKVDLLVSNPPYVPGGEGTAVDGGPTGTRMLEAIIEHVPATTPGLALLLGSLCDPLAVLKLLREQGFEVVELLARSVPFGRYTSRRQTLARLLELRRTGRAFFCDVETMKGHAPYEYLTLGIIARRSSAERMRVDGPEDHVRSLLSSYQMYGPALLPGAQFVSVMP